MSRRSKGDLMFNAPLGQRPSARMRQLADYVRGFADARENEELSDAADWLEKAAEHICAQGYFGCEGGDTCTSDHK